MRGAARFVFSARQRAARAAELAFLGWAERAMNRATAESPSTPPMQDLWGYVIDQALDALERREAVKKTTMSCDKCLAEFTSGSRVSMTRTEVNEGEAQTYLDRELPYFQGVDLCGGCTEKLLNHLQIVHTYKP